MYKADTHTHTVSYTHTPTHRQTSGTNYKLVLSNKFSIVRAAVAHTQSLGLGQVVPQLAQCGQN